MDAHGRSVRALNSDEESGRALPTVLIYPMGTTGPFDELDPKVSARHETSCCLDTIGPKHAKAEG